MGTNSGYRDSKCDFNAELAIPRPLYCGFDRSWTNSSYSRWSMEDDDDDADDATAVSDGIATTPLFFPAGPTTVVVRLRLMLAAVAAVTIARFGGILLVNQV